MPLGRITVTFQGSTVAVGYVVSGSKAFVVSTDDPQLVIVQK
jgi:hypothetical protein